MKMDSFGHPDQPTLLVISGNAPDRLLIARNAGKSFEVVEACHGNEAIDILSTRSFDAVLLDLTLPRLRGVDVLAYYRGRYPKRRNVIVTGRQEQLAAIESDAVYALMPKPFRSLALLTMLRDSVLQQPVPEILELDDVTPHLNSNRSLGICCRTQSSLRRQRGASP